MEKKHEMLLQYSQISIPQSAGPGFRLQRIDLFQEWEALKNLYHIGHSHDENHTVAPKLKASEHIRS